MSPLKAISPLKVLIGFLTFCLLWLQADLWFGRGGIPKVLSLKKAVKQQQEAVGLLKIRNQMIDAEVLDLKHRLGAIEERARTDLGMIQKGETFFQMIHKDQP